ncbi:MAG: TIM barrel protein [Anaerolineae bacterium]
MKLAVQQTLVPGESLVEKFERAVDYGFDGVELAAWGFDGPMFEAQDEIETALAAVDLQVSTLCTMGGDDFVHPDPAEREKRLAGLVRMLKLADALGAGGVVALPIRPPVHLPDLSPVADEGALITALAKSTLERALRQTPGGSATIFLEPLNRYEAYYLRTLSDAAVLCDAVERERVRVMGDFFHMNIEEASMPTAVKRHAEYLGHIHLADSNRLLPGHGHLDFVSAFGALQEIDYGGWMALECGVPGDPDETLPQAVAFLKERWEEAGSLTR